MTATVGDVLTIKGKNFILGRNRNRVFFKAGSNPAVAAKTPTSTRKLLHVVIPKGIQQYMNIKNGVVQPTRFRLRILARRLGKSYTIESRSPMISPLSAAQAGGPNGPLTPGTGPAADCDGDHIVDSVDTDDDNDLISDTQEISMGLNPCNRDTDGDGVPDGYELQSARDLNSTGGALPYPGSRPYPNPLDGSDAGTDYDGDGLSARQEYLMWTTFGDNNLATLNYSAGLKASNPLTPGTTDDDRDVDADGLGNWVEFNGPMQPLWWTKVGYPSEKPYTEPYDGTSAVNSDSDGDGLIDGADDIDHDGWTNAQEADRNAAGYRVQPFNPCLPDYFSMTCSEHPPPPGESYPPFDAPLPASPIVWP